MITWYNVFDGREKLVLQQVQVKVNGTKKSVIGRERSDD